MCKRATKEEFITKANVTHENVYNYSKVNYINNKTKVTITCPIHGDWTQRPAEHVKGKGCPKCGVIKRVDKRRNSSESFIERAKEVHANRYDYNKVVYIKAHSKVIITCTIHGDFEQAPNKHLQKKGCPSCAKTGFDKKKPGILYYLKITTEDDKKLYKIGITNRSVNERFTLTELSKIEIVKVEEFEKGQNAWDKEREILSKYKEYKYIGPDVLDSGNTELFTVDVLSLE